MTASRSARAIGDVGDARQETPDLDLERRARSVSSPENKLNSMDVTEEALVDARCEDVGRPVTAGDVVDELGIARRTAHNKLGRSSSAASWRHARSARAVGVVATDPGRQRRYTAAARPPNAPSNASANGGERSALLVAHSSSPRNTPR